MWLLVTITVWYKYKYYAAAFTQYNSNFGRESTKMHISKIEENYTVYHLFLIKLWMLPSITVPNSYIPTKLMTILFPYFSNKLWSLPDMGQALSSNAWSTSSSTWKMLKHKHKHKCFDKVNASSTKWSTIKICNELSQLTLLAMYMVISLLFIVLKIKVT